MDDADKPTLIDRLSGLMVISGASIILGAIPGGLVTAASFTPDLYWMAIAFAVIALAMVLVGGMLVGLGMYWVKRHWRSRGKI